MISLPSIGGGGVGNVSGVGIGVGVWGGGAGIDVAVAWAEFFFRRAETATLLAVFEVDASPDGGGGRVDVWRRLLLLGEVVSVVVLVVVVVSLVAVLMVAGGVAVVMLSPPFHGHFLVREPRGSVDDVISNMFSIGNVEIIHSIPVGSRVESWS